MHIGFVKIITLSIILVNLISCENQSNASNAIIAPSNGDAVFYEVYHKDCQEADISEPIYLNSQILNFHSEGIDTEAVSINYELDKTQGLPKFKSASVKNVDYLIPGETYRSTYIKLDRGQSLKICYKDYTYPNNSIEAITLKVEHIISTVHEYHNKLITHNPLSSVNLSVQPKIIDISPTGKSLPSTDNVYFAEFADGPRIVMLPHSKRWGKIFGEHNTFWNMPGVTAHEYGHFVFNHYLKSVYIASIFNTRNSCFRNFKENSKTVDLSSQEKQKTPKEFIFGALNEGFADIFASTSLENTLNIPFEIKIKCIEDDRDLNNSEFSSGTPKEMSEYVIKTFIDNDSRLRLSRVNPCRFTNFTDNHKVGAIFAFGFQRLIKSSNTLSKDQLFQVLIHFLEKLKINNEKLSTNPSSGKTLNFILNQFVDSLEKTQSTPINSVQCNILKNTFTVLPNLVTELKLDNHARCSTNKAE